MDQRKGPFSARGWVFLSLVHTDGHYGPQGPFPSLVTARGKEPPVTEKREKGLEEREVTLTRLQITVDEGLGLARIYYATQGGWEGMVLVIQDQEAGEVEIMNTIVPSPDSPPYRLALITAPDVAFERMVRDILDELAC